MMEKTWILQCSSMEQPKLCVQRRRKQRRSTTLPPQTSTAQHSDKRSGMTKHEMEEKSTNHSPNRDCIH